MGNGSDMETTTPSEAAMRAANAILARLEPAFGQWAGKDEEIATVVDRMTNLPALLTERDRLRELLREQSKYCDHCAKTLKQIVDLANINVATREILRHLGNGLNDTARATLAVTLAEAHEDLEALKRAASPHQQL